jgi:hypothetical protein
MILGIIHLNNLKMNQIYILYIRIPSFDQNFQKLSFGLPFAIFLQLFLSQDMTTLYSIGFKIINFQIKNYSKIHLNKI